MTLRILIADDEKAARFGMSKALSQLPCEIAEALDGNQALESIRSWFPHLVFLDLNMPGLDGQQVLQELSEGSPFQGEVVVVTADDAVESAVECMRLGAADYITKPYEVERLRSIARRNARRLELVERVHDLQHQLDSKTAFGALVGISRPMRELYSQIERAAQAPLDVLIRGETGTGKELIAKEIHRRSGRGDGPFVTVNAAAITPTLAESEMFGHVKGSFTGADADKKGVFEQADGGTLFLDEIGDMPHGLQTKVLRALQEREIQRVGSATAISVDVRVISATHQDLQEAIEQGHFRRDLFYRVKGVELSVPPLRQRHEDVALLANYFLDRLEARVERKVARLSGAALERLLSHHWPGNVRELEHAVTAAASMTGAEQIQPTDLDLGESGNPVAGFDLSSLAGLPLTDAKNQLVEWFERSVIEKTLEETDGNVSAAARQLGVHRQSLQQKMAQLGIRRSDRG